MREAPQLRDRLRAQDWAGALALAPDPWWQGIVYLVAGEEEAAQTAWLTAIADFPAAELPAQQERLADLLRTESAYWRELGDSSRAWLLSRYACEMAPTPSNWAQAASDALAAGLDTWEEALDQVTGEFPDLALALLRTVPDRPAAQRFFTAYRTQPDFQAQALAQLLPQLGTVPLPQPLAVTRCWAEFCAEAGGDRPEVLATLANYYQNIGENAASVPYAERLWSLSTDAPQKVAASYLWVRGLMQAGGRFTEAAAVYEHYQAAAQEVLVQNRTLPTPELLSFMTAGAFHLYFGDRPQATHEFFRQLGEFGQRHLRQRYGVFCPAPAKGDRLRVGYLSECFRRHSVGWLARWLLQYHDRQTVEVFTYSLIPTGDDLHHHFAAHSHLVPLSLAMPVPEIAARIQQDRLDILVDLDSLTSSHGCGVMALQPARHQLTWLGSDAAEVPAVEGFIVDPYVLPPAAAQAYGNTPQILPQTYIAVDGFEIGVPTYRRRDLEIPETAVVYFSAQSPYKRHPDTFRRQMQILKAVPHSFFVLKGGDRQILAQYATAIAREEGVDPQRLRVLGGDRTEEIHRANLAIADVILDTYPYNGATTTLEALWQEIPLVTQVGQQFSARNSYTMLVNAGLSEGIAWSPEEYLSWGIRLGEDPNLRQQIREKLRQSKQSAPLWDSRTFARHVEQLYRQIAT
ncbi:MAG: O-linked N-acetylglucosamine transferase, SPINDLY family protein [Pseudanabaenaceae cyanobacterium]